MTTTWEFAYLLPHAALEKPVENGHLALVPPSDGRLLALSNKHKTVRKLTSKFKDQFGRKVEPSALLIRADAPKSAYDFYAVVSFRNIVAISSIIDAWGFQLAGGSAGYPLWSDYFDFYPFSPMKDYEDLAAQSPASWEVNKPDKLSGQRAPHLPSNSRLSFGVDKAVLQACLGQWEKRFIKREQAWNTTKLFRSLEVAAQASRMPAVGTRTPTIHDAGIAVSLWVSAFEILCHPRRGEANLDRVVRLLEDVDYREPKLKAKWYVHKSRSGNVLGRINYVQKLYTELYRARCDFFHGNPVTSGNLFLSRDRNSPILLHCAPLVYRAALSVILPDDDTDTEDGGSLQNQLAAFLSNLMKAGEFEKALRACQQKINRK